MLVSSREGTTLLYYDGGLWKRELIGIGEPKETRQSPTSESPGSGDHWGTGCADAGCVGGDPLAYIATLDPFHGTAACVYTPTKQGPRGSTWKRHILDVYGTPNQLQKTGDGPGHYIICADFDGTFGRGMAAAILFRLTVLGDGNDEFILSLFGSLDRDENGESIEVRPCSNWMLNIT
jgi:hypothetical protein